MRLFGLRLKLEFPHPDTKFFENFLNFSRAYRHTGIRYHAIMLSPAQGHTTPNPHPEKFFLATTKKLVLYIIGRTSSNIPEFLVAPTFSRTATPLSADM